MPKPFSDDEKEQITSALKDAARDALKHAGVQKTTVESLVSRALIPKGTFYLFYPSKEMLFFDVFLDEHNAIRQELLDFLTASGGRFTKNDFTDIVLRLYRKVTDSFLFSLMTGGEMELVIRKLPAAVAAEHLADDDLSMSQLFEFIPEAKEKNPALFSAAFRSVFLLAMHKKEIGEAVFDDTVRLFVTAISEQLFRE